MDWFDLGHGGSVNEVVRGKKAKWIFQEFSAFGYFFRDWNAILSALGGVYVEFVFKEHKRFDSLANLQMYALGCCLISAN